MPITCPMRLPRNGCPVEISFPAVRSPGLVKIQFPLGRRRRRYRTRFDRLRYRNKTQSARQLCAYTRARTKCTSARRNRDDKADRSPLQFHCVVIVARVDRKWPPEICKACTGVLTCYTYGLTRNRRTVFIDCLSFLCTPGERICGAVWGGLGNLT